MTIKYEEVLEEGRGQRVQRSQGPKDISNSHSNTSLTLKKVHLVITSYLRPVSTNEPLIYAQTNLLNRYPFLNEFVTNFSL